MEQKLVSRSISLKSIKEFMDSEGLKIEMFKFVAESYKSSTFRMTGVVMRFGEQMLRIGPEAGAKSLQEPSMRQLDMLGLNPSAVYALMHDFVNSKLAKKGLVFLVDDVLIRLGPMKNPIVIAPERKMIGDNVENP